MARLPQPGGDDGNWGEILNEYLSESLATDGSIRPGAVTKSDVGLSNVDNTSDTNKPVSTATQVALDTKVATTQLDALTASRIQDSSSQTAVALSAATTAAIEATAPAAVVATWTKITDEQARATRPAVVAIGDSFTDNNHTSTTWNGSSASRTTAYRADGYLTCAMVAIRQSATWWDVGVSGETAADGLARFDTSVSPLRPQVVIEAFGSNDLAGGRTAEATFSDKIAMWRKAWAFGAKVIATTCPPRNTFDNAKEQEANKLNAMLRLFASTNPANFALVDWFEVFVDPLTGDWKAAQVDAAGVHPNTYGGWLVGSGPFATALRRFLPDSPPPLAMSNVNDLDNLLTNPLMTGTTGSITSNRGLTGSIGSGWTASSNGSDANLTSTLSKVARTDGYGDWHQINTTTVPTATSYVVLLKSCRSEWAVGDIVQAYVDFETDAAGWTNGLLDLQLIAVNGATILNLSSAFGVGQDTIIKARPTSGVLRTPPFVIPPGTTEVRASVLAGGLGVTRFGRIAVRKLPAAP